MMIDKVRERAEEFAVLHSPRPTTKSKAHGHVNLVSKTATA
jgi:hypothetical protein